MTRILPKDPVTIELPANLDAPSIARRYVADNAADLTAQLVGDAELLVSELVTNAVRHGEPTITLSVSVDPPGIGVFVHDDGDDLPSTPTGAPDVNDVGGRGLLIVAALASAWGITRSDEGPGKTIWFRLSIDAASTGS